MLESIVSRIRADEQLARNIRSLLRARGQNENALAFYCGHRPAWLSKILNGERGLRVKDLGIIADFFGLAVYQLFLPGIDALTERRKATNRREGAERRSGKERRRSNIGLVREWGGT